MRSLILLAITGGLVALGACGGSKTPRATGAGGTTSSTSSTSSSGGGATTTSSSGSSGGGATTTSSSGSSGGGATTTSSSGTGGSTTTSTSSSSGSPIDVVTGQHVSLIAVDATRLFYTSTYDIDTVPLAGGTPQKLNMQVGALAFGADAFVIDSGDVYWTSGFSPDTGFVLRVSKLGGTQTELVDNLAPYGQPYALAPQLGAGGAAVSVIWVSHGDGQSTSHPIVVKTTTGGTSSALGLLPVKFGTGVALDATSAYVVSPDGGNVFQVPLAGGTPVVFAGGLTQPVHIVADAQNLYVLDLGAAQGTTYPAGKIVAIPLAGGPPVTLASNLANLAQIAVGGSNVYVTSQYQTTSATADGAVLRVPITGGAPVTLASGQPSPGGIAVDGTYVYWANYGLGASDGGVRKAPR